MARYDHLPIFALAYRLALHIEQQVAKFSNHHRHGIGADLRRQAQRVLGLVIRVNGAADRTRLLTELRDTAEEINVLACCADARYGGCTNACARPPAARWSSFARAWASTAHCAIGWSRRWCGRAALRRGVGGCRCRACRLTPCAVPGGLGHDLQGRPVRSMRSRRCAWCFRRW
jgi:hypothetical protein